MSEKGNEPPTTLASTADIDILNDPHYRFQGRGFRVQTERSALEITTAIELNACAFELWRRAQLSYLTENLEHLGVVLSGDGALFLDEPVHQGSDDGRDRRGTQHAGNDEALVAFFVLCARAYYWLHRRQFRHPSFVRCLKK